MISVAMAEVRTMVRNTNDRRKRKNAVVDISGRYASAGRQGKDPILILRRLTPWEDSHPMILNGVTAHLKMTNNVFSMPETFRG